MNSACFGAPSVDMPTHLLKRNKSVVYRLSDGSADDVDIETLDANDAAYTRTLAQAETSLQQYRTIRNLFLLTLFSIVVVAVITSVSLVQMQSTVSGATTPLILATELLQKANNMTDILIRSGVVPNMTAALNDVALQAVPKFLTISALVRDTLLDFTAANTTLLASDVVEKAQQLISGVNSYAILFEQAIAARQAQLHSQETLPSNET